MISNQKENLKILFDEFLNRQCNHEVNFLVYDEYHVFIEFIKIENGKPKRFWKEIILNVQLNENNDIFKKVIKYFRGSLDPFDIDTS